ncbi:MAG: hypothetical protein ACXABO_20905 [Promethearchaeota archaeon]|jgi:predicted RNA-binding Zn-ribbon protein involved in translation (DUF1610 family)
MSTKNPTGFCPRCQQQVLLTRKEFDTCLAIILLIFTGIGFLIYLAVYYGKKEDRCVHCGTQITISQTQVPNAYQTPQEIQQSSYSVTRSESEESALTAPKFCAFCGEKLEPSSIKFCPNCGGKLT